MVSKCSQQASEERNKSIIQSCTVFHSPEIIACSHCFAQNSKYSFDYCSSCIFTYFPRDPFPLDFIGLLDYTHPIGCAYLRVVVRKVTALQWSSSYPQSRIRDWRKSGMPQLLRRIGSHRSKCRVRLQESRLWSIGFFLPGCGLNSC